VTTSHDALEAGTGFAREWKQDADYVAEVAHARRKCKLAAIGSRSPRAQSAETPAKVSRIVPCDFHKWRDDFSK